MRTILSIFFIILSISNYAYSKTNHQLANLSSDSIVESMNMDDKSSILSKVQGQSHIKQKVLSYLNDIKSMVADFIQIAPDGTSSEGKFYLSRPGKLRWQYEPPVPMLIIINNNKLIYYDYELNEVTYTNTDEAMGAFLTAQHINFNEHNVTIDNLNLKYGLIKIMLKHKTNNKKINMIFKESPLELKKIEFFDENEQQTSVSFHNIKYNVSLDNELFIFRNNLRIFKNN